MNSSEQDTLKPLTFKTKSVELESPIGFKNIELTLKKSKHSNLSEGQDLLPHLEEDILDLHQAEGLDPALEDIKKEEEDRAEALFHQTHEETVWENQVTNLVAEATTAVKTLAAIHMPTRAANEPLFSPKPSWVSNLLQNHLVTS